MHGTHTHTHTYAHAHAHTRPPPSPSLHAAGPQAHTCRLQDCGSVWVGAPSPLPPRLTLMPAPPDACLWRAAMAYRQAARHHRRAPGSNAGQWSWGGRMNGHLCTSSGGMCACVRACVCVCLCVCTSVCECVLCVHVCVPLCVCVAVWLCACACAPTPYTCYMLFITHINVKPSI